MKTTITLLLGGALLLAAGACSQPKSCDKTAKSDDKVYTGVLPAADVSGVRYTVIMDFDSPEKGDYEMISTYVQADSTGIKDVSSYLDEGDFTAGTTDKGVKYYTFTGDKGGKTFFLANSDGSITMVGDDLTPSVTEGMNYTLKEVK